MSPLVRHLSLAAAALALAGWLGLGLAERDLSRPYDVSYIPNGRATRLASLGQRLLVSDLYWLSAVQYIGEGRAEERGWEKLLPLLDLVTDLDPRHGYAYQTGGIVLSAANRPREANAILEKGVAKGPPYWTFPYYLAFNYWFYLGDYASAAHWAEVAARTPGASPNVSHLAVSLAAKSGTPEEAIALVEELRATVKDEALAARLDEQLKLAVLERDAQALERAVAAYRAGTGRAPERLEALVAAGLLPALPQDPFGGVYLLDPTDQRVHSSMNPFRFSPREAAQRSDPFSDHQDYPGKAFREPSP